MKSIKAILLAVLFYIPGVWAADPADLNIKYSSNYLMPAYVHFQSDGFEYTIKANINVPLYNIQFTSKGAQSSNFFNMLSYKDTRNDKPYAEAKIANRQLSYYDKLPNSFQITNGKKLYPMENVALNTTKKQIKYNKQDVTEITYQFKTGNKDIVVKKHEGEKFPRFISYNRDGDEYELTFSEFVKK